ncbi:hypothetical protein BU23DRAFT_573723 [Bimuria novae-zelandiae CBS 107.79]|uniref:Protein kinase domain-containing protein n=1 Tax=Bimuria novae-zelandiae CBS 107.79 TaxID=1447943 RepID=A0A6A5UPB6_9PLEO|nr:hypothetical protein BU23DRAFT_573723 [Bimuria novae-zelandiae CBS 107.79]
MSAPVDRVPFVLDGAGGGGAPVDADPVVEPPVPDDPPPIPGDHPEEPARHEELDKWNPFPGAGPQCLWHFVEFIYDRGAQDDEVWKSSNVLYVATNAENVIHGRMVLKSTVWNPHHAMATTGFDNTHQAVGLTLTFPNSNDDPPLKEAPEEEMEPAEWDELDEEEKEERRAAIPMAQGLRQYIDWAPGKSLDKLFDIYNERSPEKQIPEPFIWMVFYNVATVLHYVSTRGAVWNENSTANQRGNEEFGTLVHCAPLRPLPYPPTRRLGPSLELGRWDPDATDSGRGDINWRAPENRSQTDDPVPQGLPPAYLPPAYLPPADLPPADFPNVDLTSKTDIWSLGLVIWELMNSTVPVATRDDWHTTIVEKYDYTDFNLAQEQPGYNGFYSNALRTLRDRCLRIRPDTRPTPHKIAEESRRNLEGRLPKSVGRFAQGEMDPHLRLEYRREQFEMRVKFRRRVGEER